MERKYFSIENNHFLYIQQIDFIHFKITKLNNELIFHEYKMHREKSFIIVFQDLLGKT